VSTVPTSAVISDSNAPISSQPSIPLKSHFRRDIEGLRALAVGLVLLYHAGITFIPGGFVGVDVFFVISGFLITAMLLREVQRDGQISLARFYAKRVRRLLPAATLVLVTSALLVWTVGPSTQRSAYGGDVVASALSLVNWRFAERAVDYQAQGIDASPVQHFWSLSVEEQFYFVWPLLLLAVAFAVRHWHGKLMVTSVVALLAITLPSLAWSVIATNAEPASAFFATTTRLWELGVGALVATGVVLWRKIPAWLAYVLGWGGLVAIVVAALTVDAASVWPGWLALVPTLGTAAVIIAGTRDRPRSPVMLSWKPAVWLGGLSYSLYLWHWPLLVAAGWQWGDLGQKRGLLIVLLSLVPAWLSYKLVESPVRRSKSLSNSTPLALAVGANLAAIGVIAGLVLAGSTPRATVDIDPDRAIGAETLKFDGTDVSGVDVEVANDPYTPAAANSSEDRPATYGEDCHRDQKSPDPAMCRWGKVGGEIRLVLAGDSKAAQWSDAIDEASKNQGWEFDLSTKSACHFANVSVNDGNGRPYDSCLEHTANLQDLLLADPPDAVIVSQGASDGFNAKGVLSTSTMRDGLIDEWEILENAGIDVIVLINNPSPVDLPTGGSQVPECVVEYAEAYDACAFDRAKGVASSSAVVQLEAAKAVPDVDVLDMTDTLCDDTTCPPVIGNVLVYRQGTHITNTYARSAATILEERLAAIVESNIAK
jgi:peptidoglycan/LPS O-acetylase OafA/YrhL